MGPAAAHIRRLTTTELRNTAADVFLGGKDVDAVFPAEGVPRKYDNLATALTVSSVWAEALRDWAEKVAASTRVTSACDVAKRGEMGCLDDLLTGPARRTFRRPLTDAERARYTALFTTVRAAGTFADAIGTVVAGMLQSPSFLFRTELGARAGDPKTPLSGYETASALSYFLWSSGPDEALLDAAAAGRLASRDEIDAQVTRMLASPRHSATRQAFVLQWLEAAGSESASLDSKAYPQWGPALGAAAADEMAKFVEASLGGATGWQGLFASQALFANATLAPVLGTAKRTGFFTHPAFLALHAPPAGFSPVRIGRFVRQKLFCQVLPDPPADVPSIAPPSDAVTSRQRFANHAQPSCAGCHRQMDPIGFGLEQYDAMGRFHDTDAGSTLTGAGQLVGTDVDGTFTGPDGLAAKVGSSQEVAACFGANVFDFALGREVALDTNLGDFERKSLSDVARIHAAGPDFVASVVRAVATSDAFLIRDASSVPAGGS